MVPTATPALALAALGHSDASLCSEPTKGDSRSSFLVPYTPGMAWTRITFEPGKMGGHACIRGMRLSVSTIIRMIASGMSIAEVIDAHPKLEEADVKEALEYAAALAEERVIPLRPTGS